MTLMKHLLSVVAERLRKAFKVMYEFLEKHGFFNAIVENLVRLCFFLIILYIFGIVVW